MPAQVLDGKQLSSRIEADLSARVARLKDKTGRTPILATILVGADPASATYVKMKGNACRRVGMESLKVELASDPPKPQPLDRSARHKGRKNGVGGKRG